VRLPTFKPAEITYLIRGVGFGLGIGFGLGAGYPEVAYTVCSFRTVA